MPVLAVALMYGYTMEGYIVGMDHIMIITYSSVVPYILGIVGGILYCENLRKSNEQSKNKV